MKRLSVCVLLAGIIASVTTAAPTFVTGRMVDRRNSLTDEQYEYLWSIGAQPQIKQSVARDWAFRASRYQNVTNWLDICGSSNNFAALSFSLQDSNFKLEETNAVLVATNKQLRATCISLAELANYEFCQYTNQLAQTTALSNLYIVVSAQALAATAKIQDEVTDLQAKIVTYQEYQTKYPLLKKIFAAMITDAENRIKILQALTGGDQ